MPHIKGAPFAVDVYLLAVFAVSGYFGFVFFQDSKTYLAHVVTVPILTQILAVYPVGSAVLSAVNLLLLRRIVLDYRINIITLSLLAPYSLLLISNSTKEAVIFLFLAGAFMIRLRLKSQLARRFATAASAIGMIVRPVYLPLMIARLRSWQFVAIALIGTVIALFGAIIALQASEAVQAMTSSFWERTEGRSEVIHTGRDFFAYLCVKEKANLSNFSACWAPVLLGVPVHEDTLSLSYLPYGMFEFPFLVIVYTLFTSREVIAWNLGSLMLAMHFFIFLVSPTFGAFLRYTYPVVWFGGFYILSKYPWRFRRVVVGKRRPIP